MTNKQDLIYKALLFAVRAHEGQTRDGGEMYIDHPVQTAMIVRQITDDPEMIAAAYLHDTIEDTDTTYDDLLANFGKRVADIVYEVTNEGTDKSGHYFPRLQSRDAILIKFADRLSNLSDMGSWDEKRVAHYLKKTKFWKSEV